jgi:hypothetical protein
MWDIMNLTWYDQLDSELAPAFVDAMCLTATTGEVYAGVSEDWRLWHLAYMSI